MSERNVVWLMIQKAISNERFLLNDDKASRDFLYIDDAIEGLIKAAEHGKSSVYNLGTGVETTLKLLLKEVNNLVGEK